MGDRQASAIPDQREGPAYRAAQAHRFERYCFELGIDVEDVIEGRVRVDLGAIQGPDGTIWPEPVDFGS